MGREIDNIVEILHFYKVLGFNELPEEFIQSLLGKNYGAPSVLENSESFKNFNPLMILNQEIKACKRCNLSNSRKNPVCGEGNINAKLMFVGEIPNIDEALQGRLFVGETGKLLTSLIEKMGFKREDVYITNTVKCYLQGNIESLETEISTCFNYLKREIEIISPRVIISLGVVPTYALMGMNRKLIDIDISKLRGIVFYYNQIPVIPTYHPSHLLINKKDKWLTWKDAQEALRRLK